MKAANCDILATPRGGAEPSWSRTAYTRAKCILDRAELGNVR